MSKFHFTNKAVEDLSAIWNYTLENWSENQADKYYHQLLSSCKEIAENPKLGKEYDILNRGIKGFKFGQHIIFYSIISKNEIEIIRILHGMMDLKGRI